jgi:hypothetical protein
MFVQKRSKGLQAEERQIPVEDENVVETLPPRAGNSNGVSRTELFSLPQGLDGRKGFQVVAHLLSPVTDENGDPIGLAIQDGFQEIPQHRFVEDRKENLGKVALHASPLSRGHNENP